MPPGNPIGRRPPPARRPRRDGARADPSFERWLEETYARHMKRLTFAEVRRSVQALSSLYVERRERLAGGLAFRGEGKRAAFAVFYAPMHFLAVREVVGRLGLGEKSLRRIQDLGCGTAAGGAAWALEAGRRPAVAGVDLNPWAVSEARRTLHALGLRGSVRVAPIEREPLSGDGSGVLLAYTANEMQPAARDGLLPRLVEARRRGACIIVIEPLSRRTAPWWGGWAAAFEREGGRAGEWRFRCGLPRLLRDLDRAAGLDHTVLTCRSLVLA